VVSLRVGSTLPGGGLSVSGGVKERAFQSTILIGASPTSRSSSESRMNSSRCPRLTRSSRCRLRAQQCAVACPRLPRTSCFQEVWVVIDCLREFQPGLMLDDVEDLIDREIRGVKVVESSVFVVVGEASLGVGA